MAIRQGRFRLSIRKKSSSERAARQWHRLHRKVLESPSLEKHVDVALRNMISGCHGDGLTVGPSDPSGLFSLNDSMILFPLLLSWGK